MASLTASPWLEGSDHHTYFPSLIIGPQGQLQPQGSFAEAQAVYLDPDPQVVQQLTQLLQDTRVGVVAHYYMDVELQGVLQAVASLLPGRIGVADSLRMGDMAVEMVEQQGVQAVVCLGVDFMSESVAAILAQRGHQTPVYRASARAIGCSLAESAERDAYRAWLQRQGAPGQPALHVVYINTSLETKAVSSSLVPTITCTSSNVLATMLQASAQMGPDLRILYGPDTYMGHNLRTLLSVVVERWDDDKIARQLHPNHNRHTLQQLRDSIQVFPSGNCIVHHMFGAAVVDTVRRTYYDQPDCFITAHLEVPGEMFEVAMEKSLSDQGVVGSTSDILNFVTRKVREAAARRESSPSTLSNHKRRLKFILGTEAGMVTSIVRAAQGILESTGISSIEAEIIFPVAQEAMTVTQEDTNDATGRPSLPLVPGVSGGEGCSTAGGCATCPFMKMNDLDALMDVLQMVRSGQSSLRLLGHLPPNRLLGKLMDGRPAIQVGSDPILFMRAFMKENQLPEELVDRIRKHAQTTN